MIDRSKINGDRLVDMLMTTRMGNTNAWWHSVEFIESYVPENPGPDYRPNKVSIRCGGSFLRHIGFGHYIWDLHYGEDSEFHSHEMALLCLRDAPVPPFCLRDEYRS